MAYIRKNTCVIKIYVWKFSLLLILTLFCHYSKLVQIAFQCMGVEIAWLKIFCIHVHEYSINLDNCSRYVLEDEFFTFRSLCTIQYQKKKKKMHVEIKKYMKKILRVPFSDAIQMCFKRKMHIRPYFEDGNWSHVSPLYT